MEQIARIMLTRVRYAVLLTASLLWTLASSAVPAQPPLLKNGDLEQIEADNDANPGNTAHWSGYRWDGHGRITAVAAAAKGRRAIMIEGSGPSKQAIFQDVTLPACTYTLSASVAGRNLRPNQWQQSAAAYIALHDGGQVFQDIFKGDSDWRRMQLQFEVKLAGKVTIYFFNYGGGGLFVDDISLQARSNCAPLKQVFKLASKPYARLTYEAPLTSADLALRGYCSDKSFARTPLCKRLHKADLSSLARKRASKPKIIADFGQYQPFEPGNWQKLNADAARLSPGHYMSATPQSGLAGDWRGYDWLSFEANNPTAQPQKLYVEIHDSQSSGYWSRVNHYTMIPPGRSSQQIPLQNFVGEKSVIKQRRRLDLAHIRKLVFSALEAKSKLDISAVELTSEPPYKHDFPRLIKLDAGPPTGPLLHGFTPLHPEHAYRPERGYGYSADAVLARTEDRRHPDDLLRDWSSLTKGGIDVDLPNGRYHVWMMLEDPGYWEFYPSFKRRKVMAEGQTVLDERQNAERFLRKFYHHADHGDLPGDDIWSRYIRPRYRPLRFDVLVRDGQLNLRFDGADNPYALALSALIIYPHADKAKGEAFLDEMWDRLKQQYDRNHQQITPPPPLHAKVQGNALSGKLSLFQRSAAIDVHSSDFARKGEQLASFALQLSRGETTPLTLSLRAQETMQLTGAKLELPGLKVTPFKVRSKLTRRTIDGSVYWNAPRLLDPLKLSTESPLHLPRQVTRRLWFDVEAPANSSAKQSDGWLRLQFGNGTLLSLPVTATIHPWRLPELDISHGYLGITPNYPATPWPQIAQKAKDETAAAIRLLAAHGMNRFSGGLGGPVFNGYDKGRVQMDFAKADKTMGLLGNKGRGPVESYLGLAIEDLSSYHPDEGAVEQHGKSYGKIVRDVLAAIERHGKVKDWRQIRHVVGDEPDGEAVGQSVAAAKAFKAAGANTSIFTSISQLPRDSERLKFAGLIDLLYLNHHSRKAIKAIRRKGSACALYNRRNRYQRGIYLLKLRQLGCSGHMQFAFSSTHVDHWYDLDGREDDQVAVFTHPDGRLRPALDLKRYRMAITDYRYLLKLQQAIKTSRKPSARTKAQNWLQALLGKMKVGHQHPAPWGPAQLDRIRQQAARLINSL